MLIKINCHGGIIAGAVQLQGGLRLHGEEKHIRAGLPLITIITATYNAAQYLPRTIKSIREQTYENIEWIIIDGNSTDETIELIQQNEDVIDYWMSEPDAGIYDAWNKGISLARGDWVAFLGAGDSYKPYSVKGYMDAINATTVVPELVSSRAQFVNSDGLVLRAWGGPFKWDKFKRYMTIAHAGALHHKSLFEKHGLFDTAYSSSADYEFLMRCGASLRTIYLDVISVDMLVGGISNSYKGMFETYLIQKRYGAGISAKFRFWFACAKRFLRPLLRGY